MRPRAAPEVEVRVGPPVRTIAADDEVLVCAPDGSVRPDRQEGYFCADTRVASLVELRLGGARPQLLDSAAVTPWSARFEFTNPDLPSRDGTVPARTLHLRVDRMLGRGMHEDLSLANYSQRTVELRLTLRVEGDYRDVFEVKAGETAPRARPETIVDGEAARITTRYRVGSFCRGLIVEAAQGAPTARAQGNELSFDVTVPAGEEWRGCVLWRPIVGDVEPPPPLHGCHDLLGEQSGAGRAVAGWVSDGTTVVRTGVPPLDALVDTAVADLAALRLYRPVHAAHAADGAHDEPWLVAAGIPWFIAPFGRDALVTGLQTLALSPAIARGSLEVLAQFQGTDDDPLHDEEPGKIIHELRHGELAHFHRVPQTPYFGSHDAPALFVLAAARLWEWTGDDALVRRLAPAVGRALAWVDNRGDLDGDGFQEYRPRSGQWGYYNQGWKDAGDAIVHEDGQLATHPIATCELQGYVIDAKRRWAGVAEAVLGRPSDAKRLRDEADRLADALEARFWWEAEHTYYLALDGDKQPVRSVASNAGHLLWAGAVSPDRAERVARRFLEDDMWSGWGVRTLSARHPAFNPMSYQRGTIWPHENAMLVEGLLRYGLAGPAAEIARGVLEAAACFDRHQLPELFAGFGREPGGFPVQYLGANVPQAWASGAVVQLVTAFAGLRPCAHEGVLRVSPHLPDWVPQLRLERLRVGDSAIDMAIAGGQVVVQRVAGTVRVTS